MLMDNTGFLESMARKSDGGSLRGDYTQADASFVVRQDMAAYTAEQHALWRRLYERQARLLPGRACDEFIACLARLEADAAIPDFGRASNALFRATGWQIVAVPGLIPEQAFFEHLACRRFPVTVWLREPHEFDYIVEPDVFHDFFGHVPLLFDPVFADHLQEYGKGGLKATRLGGLDYLARLYWYTIEFGLVKSEHGLRAYGAGILSSGGEIKYCLESPDPKRVRFDVERVMRTLYKIDSYQHSYFVIDDFRQLFDDTAPDFTPIYERLKTLPPLDADSLLPGERDLSPAGRPEHAGD
jgi:phenylalanine-4-hydroxylase